MPTETKNVEWVKEKAFEKIVNLKVVTINWECNHTEEGCSFTYNYSVVRKKRKCDRNMNHFAKDSAKWFWGLVAAVAAILAMIATGGGAAILGIGAAGWAAIAGGSAGIAAVAAALKEFDDKYKECDPVTVPDPESKSETLTSEGDNCEAFCVEELTKLWATLLEKK